MSKRRILLATTALALLVGSAVASGQTVDPTATMTAATAGSTAGTTIGATDPTAPGPNPGAIAPVDPAGATATGAIAGTTSGATTTTATTPPTTTAANAGAFGHLSPGGRRITRALYDAQTQPVSAGTTTDGTATGTATGGTAPWTLDQIAAAKQGNGWGGVFRDMQAQGLVQARNLGEVVSGANRRAAATGGAETGAGMGAGTGTGTGTGTGAGSAPASIPLGNMPVDPTVVARRGTTVIVYANGDNATVNIGRGVGRGGAATGAGGRHEYAFARRGDDRHEIRHERWEHRPEHREHRYEHRHAHRLQRMPVIRQIPVTTGNGASATGGSAMVARGTDGGNGRILTRPTPSHATAVTQAANRHVVVTAAGGGHRYGGHESRERGGGHRGRGKD
jgi:hypothetical protein